MATAYTTSTTLGGAGGHVIPKFYADFMRDRLWSSLYFRQLGTDVTVPRGYETVKIPRWKAPYTIDDDTRNPTEVANLAAISQLSTETDDIEAVVISAESISGDAVIFGGAIGYSDKANLVSHASISDGATENLLRELAWRLDNYAVGQISGTASSNEIHVISGTDTVTKASDVLQSTHIAKLGPHLDSYNVPRWEDETFVCVCHPLTMYDLITEDGTATAFLEVTKYTDPSYVYRGEVGRMYGIRFIQSNNVPVVYNNSADTEGISAGVYGTHAYVVAPDAYYNIIQEGGGVQVIHHPPGSAGTADPINLKGTIGVKVYYGVKAAPATDHRLWWLTYALSLLN